MARHQIVQVGGSEVERQQQLDAVLDQIITRRKSAYQRLAQSGAQAPVFKRKDAEAPSLAPFRVLQL